jgi:hypothetical protein
MTRINFVGVYWNYEPTTLPDAGLQGFIVTFYDDDPASPGQPLGNPEDAIGVLYQETVVAWGSQQLSTCEGASICEFAYQATLPLPFEALRGHLYWVSVQAIMPYADPQPWGQMAFGGTAADHGAPAVRGFPVLGVGWWEPIIVGQAIDLAFQLRGDCCVCDDGDPCTNDLWDPGAQQCVYWPIQCNDGLFCNGIETCVGGDCQAGTPVDCDDGQPCTEDSCNEGTDSCDHITCPPCPMIDQQPGCANAATGADATFTVVVALHTVVGPLQIEWFKDGVPVGSGPTLTLQNVQPGDHGARIHCVATDVCGTTVSDTVALIVGQGETPEDGDGDCDVDVRDYAEFQRCFTGSSPPAPPSGACATVFDRDADDDIDGDDFALYAQALAGPQNGCPYSDSWATDLTPGNETSYGLNLPADFFGPGSDPFTEMVALIGQASEPEEFASSDTRVGHRPLRFPPYEGYPIVRQVETKMLSLHLAGKDPITVTYNGGQSEEPWLVAVALSMVAPDPGVLTATLECPNGGHFDATVHVQPAIGFVRPTDLAMRGLDAGVEGLDPITMDFVGRPFALALPPELDIFTTECAGGDFTPGVDGCGQRVQTTCVSHIHPGDIHYFCPPECQPPDRCLYEYGGTFSWVVEGETCLDPFFPAVVGGEVCTKQTDCDLTIPYVDNCPGAFPGDVGPAYIADYVLTAECGAFQCP